MKHRITVFLTQEVRCRPQYHPRRLLQQIEKWKKPSIPHLVGNVGHSGSIVLIVRAKIGKYACHHSVTAPVAAPRFRDKRGNHECTSLFHTPPLRVKFLWKAHTAKILLREIFSREPFIARKFPDIRYYMVPLLLHTLFSLYTSMPITWRSIPPQVLPPQCWLTTSGPRKGRFWSR